MLNETIKDWEKDAEFHKTVVESLNEWVSNQNTAISFELDTGTFQFKFCTIEVVLKDKYISQDVAPVVNDHFVKDVVSFITKTFNLQKDNIKFNNSLNSIWIHY